MATGQILIKWRVQNLDHHYHQFGIVSRITSYLADKYIVLAYFIALLGSLVWLLIVPRINLSIGFPIYMGSTFLFVIIGSSFFLGEVISMRLWIAAIFILIGISLGALD